MTEAKITIDAIMAEMEDRVVKNQPISAGSWVESALRINSLIGDIDNQIASYDAKIAEIEAELVKADIPASKAKILAKSQINYEKYLKLKAKKDKIHQYIMLAKKRAEIRDL